MIRPWALACLLLVALSAAATLRPAAAPRLEDLHSIGELKTLFNQDAGRVRLILLVSPT